MTTYRFTRIDRHQDDLEDIITPALALRILGQELFSRLQDKAEPGQVGKTSCYAVEYRGYVFVCHGTRN